MKTFAFVIKRKDLNDEQLTYFENDLITSFKSLDYMQGYALGYGFGKIQIVELNDLQKKYNKTLLKEPDDYIFFVNVENVYTCGNYGD